ncbi:hypothetical protein BDN67DRAFT_443201 [Paxillus ammoniavirescens]|nr:hypothetical protein BDN67DRAFT_443201 [Paxillus ammoniavirescens]
MPGNETTSIPLISGPTHLARPRVPGGRMPSTRPPVSLRLHHYLQVFLPSIPTDVHTLRLGMGSYAFRLLGCASFIRSYNRTAHILCTSFSERQTPPQSPGEIPIALEFCLVSLIPKYHRTKVFTVLCVGNFYLFVFMTSP